MAIQFFTPRQVVNFIVEFTRPRPDQIICDPACGSGGFLIETASYMKKHKQNNFRLMGLEIDRRMAWTAQMNLLMHGDRQGAIYHLREGGSLAFSDHLNKIAPSNSIYLTQGERALAHLAPKIFICSPDQFRNAARGIRLNVPFHHPSRKIAEEILSRSIYPTPKLAELVVTRNITAIPTKQDPDEIWNYIGLANIVPDKGEYTVSQMMGRHIKSHVRLYRPGDILFSKLRPELRKCVLIRDNENEGFASSECLIFCTRERAIDDPDLTDKPLPQIKWQIDKEYLAFLLRSDIIFGQIVYQITGVGRPRVNQSAILSLKIPLPPLSVQREIVATYKMAWQHFINCRARSRTILEEGEQTLKTADSQIRESLCPNGN